MKKKTMIFAIFTLLFFGIFIKINYSVDTYLLFASQNLGYVQEYLRSGRLVTVIFFRFMQLMKMQPEMMYSISFIIAIACITCAMSILFNVLKKYIKDEMLSGLVTIMIIINPFVIELWLFVEMGIMMLSILASVIAFKYFDEFIEQKDKKNIYLCIFFLTIALFSYQGTVGIFIALSVLTIIINSTNIKHFLKNNLWMFLCYGIPTIINFLVVMLIGNTRVGVKNNYFETFKFIINASGKHLFSGFGLYPISLFIILHIVSLLYVLFLILKQKQDKSKKCFYLLYIILMTYFFTIITIIPQDIKSAVMFPRNSYSFGSIIGIIFAFAIILLTKEEKKNQNKIMIYISFIVLLMEFVQFTIIGINRYIVNYMDKYIALQIEEKINKYEKETGYTIKKLAIYNLDNSEVFYPDLQDMINVSAKSEKLSNKALLVFYLRKELIDAEEDSKIYNKYFKDKNWKFFDLDQIVFYENTMHWYLY